MTLTIKGSPKKPTKKAVVKGAPAGQSTDYSAHLGGPMSAKTGSGNLEIIKVNNKTKQTTVLADEEIQMPAVVMIPADQLASVSVGGSQTINIGDFNSVKISVHLSLPSHIHDLEATFEHASNWVSGKMEESVKAIKG